MCTLGNKGKKTPPPPPPPAATILDQAAPTAAEDESDRNRRKSGRKALRNDLKIDTETTGTGVRVAV